MPAPKVYRNRPAPDPKPQVEVEGKPAFDERSKKGEIKAYLRSKGIEYTTRMTKEELLELV